MTLSSTTTKAGYGGDGSTTVFPVPFKFLENGHVKAVLRDETAVPVTETTWVENTHYTLTGAGNEAGGTVTAASAPVSGQTLLIKRTVPETQGTDLPLGGAFPSQSVEEALDRLTMMVQAHSEEIARTLLLPETSDVTGLTLPAPAAGKILTWNEAGDNLENTSVADLGLTPVSEFIETLLDDVNAAAARATLGIDNFVNLPQRAKTAARLALWNLTK
ncbi:MAG: phage tail fiber protein [Rhodospirillales bacterium]